MLIIGIKLIVYFTHSQLSTLGIYSGLISLLLMVIPLIMAINNRKTELDGYIGLKEVMKVGLGIAVITGLITSAFTYLYFQFIDHETAELVIINTREYLLKEKKPQSEIDLSILAIRDFYSPFNQAFGVLTGVLISCLILSFISSTFLVKSPSQTAN